MKKKNYMYLFRKLKISIIIVILGINFQHLPISFASSSEYESFSLELISMFKADQAVRQNLSLNDQEKMDEVLSTDRRNSKRLHEIILAIGWPTSSKVGAEASKGAFFIAQHAVHDLSLMELALLNIEASYKSGEVPGSYFAMIYDRVKMLHGEPQKYGTQVQKNNKSCGAYKLVDKDKVDIYRKEVGLLKDLKSYEAEVCHRDD